MKFRIIFTVITAGLFNFSANSFALSSYFLPENFWFIEENSGAGNIASANSVIAGFTPGEGFLMNPATINMMVQYAVSGQKSFNDSSYQINVQDSRTSAIGGALSVKRLSPVYDVASLEDTIKLALNFGGGQMFMGIMGKRNFIRGEKDPHYNLDAGLLIDFNNYVKIGATYQNILQSDYQFSRGKILSLGLGVTFFQSLEIYAAYKKVVQSSLDLWQKWDGQIISETSAWMVTQNKNNNESFHLAARYTLFGATISAGAIILPNKNSFWTGGARYQYNSLALQYAIFGIINGKNADGTTAFPLAPMHELSLTFTL